MAYFPIIALSLFFGLAHQASIPTNLVEVYFVVDQAVVAMYESELTSMSWSARKAKALEKVRTDIEYFITEINVLYQSLQDRGLSIGIAKKKLDILDTNIFNNLVDVDKGLPAFDNWLKQEDAFSKIGYDAAILWTGHELTSQGDKGTAGYAHVGEVCKDSATGIAEYDGTYHTVVVAAHEIGHILGAGHDSLVTGFVMIPRSSTSEENRWKFSGCSREAFDVVMGKLEENCLRQKSWSTSMSSQEITTDLANPDTICRRAEGNQQSYMCKAPHFYGGSAPKGDQVCQTIWCKDIGNGGFCSGAFSSDGLICGTNKRCNEGKCVYSSDSESSGVANEDCIWGDQATVSYNTNKGSFTGSCADFIKFAGSEMCGQNSVQQECCVTCQNVDTGIPGCRFGDTYPYCDSYTQAQICGNANNRELCCEFCHGYKKKRSDDDTSSVNLDPNEQNTAEDKLKKNPSRGRHGDSDSPHEQE